jgi:hypothetical protein
LETSTPGAVMSIPWPQSRRWSTEIRTTSLLLERRTGRGSRPCRGATRQRRRLSHIGAGICTGLPVLGSRRIGQVAPSSMLCAR